MDAKLETIRNEVAAAALTDESGNCKPVKDAASLLAFMEAVKEGMHSRMETEKEAMMTSCAADLEITL